MFDDILYTHYILIYSTYNGDDAPQNRNELVVGTIPHKKTIRKETTSSITVLTRYHHQQKNKEEKSVGIEHVIQSELYVSRCVGT